MAHVTGTATDYADLFAKLKTFLTSNADLVAASEQWTVVWTAPSGAANPTDVVVKGPGLSADDNVFVGMRLVANPGPDTYWIELVGMTGILPGATTFDGHIGVMPYPVRMFLDDQPMGYWFVASGRRFIVVAKISTVFEAMYAGLFLPYADPVAYPYPMFIGGSGGPNGDTGTPDGWRSVVNAHRHFTSPFNFVDLSADHARANALMLSPSGEWLQVASGIPAGYTQLNPQFQAAVGLHPERSFGGVFQSTSNSAGDSNLVADLNGGVFNEDVLRQKMTACYGGELSLVPMTLIQKSPAQTYGILDGAYRIPGVNNSSENIVTVDGNEHLVVQNVFRTGIGDYWALALEGITDPLADS